MSSKKLCFGDFAIIGGKIGEGGFGSIYKVVQLGQGGGGIFAMKVQKERDEPTKIVAKQEKQVRNSFS